uniref:Putative secreted protein n=1 Tax=Anopheles darlingi TaxID=43151 RepID=A0A2M4DJU8_ANODA
MTICSTFGGPPGSWLSCFSLMSCRIALVMASRAAISFAAAFLLPWRRGIDTTVSTRRRSLCRAATSIPVPADSPNRRNVSASGPDSAWRIEEEEWMDTSECCMSC